MRDDLKAISKTVLLLAIYGVFLYLLTICAKRGRAVNKPVNKFDKAKVILVRDNKSDTVEIDKGTFVVNQNNKTLVIFPDDKR